MIENKRTVSIIIDAFDTLFFRDGRPFSMGDETWADGFFPPPPSVVYGALRTGYFAQHIDEFTSAATDNDCTDDLVIRALFYRIIPGNNIYFPAPLDLVERTDKTNAIKQQEANDKRYSVELLSLIPQNGGCSSLDKGLQLLKSGNRVEPVDKGLMEIFDLKSYLNYGSQMKSGFSFKIRKSSDYICSESKIGIGRDDQTRASGDTGKLYRVGMQRLASRGGTSRLELGVVYDNLCLPDSGILRMGAEGKCVACRPGSMPEFDISALRQSESRRFKLYLMTPGIFDNGWVADWMLQGAYKGIDFELIGAASGRSMHLGGFDMKQGKPKPMRKAVPAGSVYYFELKNGKTVGECFDPLFEAFHFKSLAGQPSAKNKEGCGIALLGTGA